MSRPRVLILANDCNPDWPSLPVVGYKYARSLARIADVTLATHVRNRENIEKAGDFGARVVYIDNEWIAAPMYKLALRLRRGAEVAWSVQQVMTYLPYLEFERRVLKTFQRDLSRGDFDIVHRITPMSPTLPSYIAGRTKQPFVIGPLNGNLDWPAAFQKEQKRERELLRNLRHFYRYMPFSRRTVARAAAVLAAFDHTARGLTDAKPERIVSLPEIGFDPTVFHPGDRAAPFSGPGAYRFLYVGRLVPYKLPEAAIRGFAASDTLRPHRLEIIGDGPERPRLEAIVREAGNGDRVLFSGRKTQSEVAEAMRRADALVFPSIRELGAGVVVEAMASGMVTIVTGYGAPGDLAANGRGVVVPLGPLETIVDGVRGAMEGCLADPEAHAAIAAAGELFARENFQWDTKAAFTLRVYKALLEKKPLADLTDYH